MISSLFVNNGRSHCGSWNSENSLENMVSSINRLIRCRNTISVWVVVVDIGVPCWDSPDSVLKCISIVSHKGKEVSVVRITTIGMVGQKK